MNKKKVFRFFGIMGILAGLSLLAQGFFNLTGYVISRESYYTYTFPMGFVFFVFGVILFLVSRRQSIEKILNDHQIGVVVKNIRDLIPGKKGAPSESRKMIYNELADMLENKYIGGNPHVYTAPGSLHLPKGTKIKTIDADQISIATHQLGRGSYRHVFEPKTGYYMGLAVHKKNNDLIWVYRV
jgi:hypothetical protein